jgi:hypothetical protein
MGRKKVSNPRQAKTISLSQTTWKEVENRGMNRSKTIQTALTAWFDWSEYDWREISNSDLIRIIRGRHFHKQGRDKMFKKLTRLLNEIEQIEAQEEE